MRLKYDFSFQQYDDKYMAIADYEASEEDLRLLWVNAVGKETMQLLQDDISLDEVIAALKERYQADGDAIDASVKKFIDEIDSAGLLVKE